MHVLNGKEFILHNCVLHVTCCKSAKYLHVNTKAKLQATYIYQKHVGFMRVNSVKTLSSQNSHKWLYQLYKTLLNQETFTSQLLYRTTRLCMNKDK